MDVVLATLIVKKNEVLQGLGAWHERKSKTTLDSTRKSWLNSRRIKDDKNIPYRYNVVWDIYSELY